MEISFYNRFQIHLFSYLIIFIFLVENKINKNLIVHDLTDHDGATLVCRPQLSKRQVIFLIRIVYY